MQKSGPTDLILWICFIGEYAGFDETQPTAESGGKGKVIKLLKEKFHFKKIVMVGDGATDMEACPPAVCIKHTHFYAACENETKTCITIKQKKQIKHVQSQYIN